MTVANTAGVDARSTLKQHDRGDTGGVPLVAWLLGLARDGVATAGLARVGRGLLGTKEEVVLHAALVNAARVAAIDFVAGAKSQQFAAESLTELLSVAELPGFSAVSVSALDDLEAAVGGAVRALWEMSSVGGATHATELGITCSADELTGRLVSEFVRSLGLQCETDSPLVPLIALLLTQQNRRDLDRLAIADPALFGRSGVGDQATQVNAWVSTSADPPKVFVMNHSESPIFDVRPSAALVGYDSGGEVSAMVGHTPLEIARQVDPHGGYCWPLAQCRGWGGPAAVKGQVHVHFKDAAGRSWLLGHDHLSLGDDPRG